ncbi:DUF418 domain-containing protein [Deinococcus sp.]|uniref:DUF418 domain-containing protein n=1 Tax=Deinococcus sp. TaxID=47478 RepID=UPI00260024C6|nr:DUF418 domain-containing protein [Deinococcus sp.]
MPAPTPPPERDLLPDVLRGGALLAILCVNMQNFAGYSEWTQRGADRAAQVFIDVLLNGKGISVFAMLFGAGAFTLLSRGGRGLLLRRLLVLLLLGGLHGVLVWRGDIIANYAAVAVVLVLLEWARPRALVLTGVACAAFWALPLAHEAFTAPLGLRGSPDLEVSGPYLSLVRGRAEAWLPELGAVVEFDGFWILALMCFGGALHRCGLLRWPEQHRRTLRWLLWAGLGLGLPLSAALAYTNTLGSYSAELWGILARLLGGLAGGLAYVGGAGLLAASGRLGALRMLAAPGRLTLSGYLAQSLVMTSLFYGYGLNLGHGPGQHWGAAACLLLALAFGAAQVGLSSLSLKRFRTGPAEVLVRALVYGRQAK